MKQWTTKIVDLSTLKFASYNPRKMSERAMGGLKKSIDRFGLVQPIVVNQKTGNVVGGHQRIEALKQLGHDSAQIVLVELDDTEEKALNIALNSQAIEGEFDVEKLKPLLDELSCYSSELFSELKFDDLEKMLGLVEKENNYFKEIEEIDVRFRVIVECLNEKHQLDLLEKFKKEGLECSALML